MKEEFINLYMGFAEKIAQLSKAQRLKVGALLVKDDNIVYGYNGTPKGWDNTCEDKIYIIPEMLDTNSDQVYYDEVGAYILKTKQYVSHAEKNLIMKLATSTISSEGGILFLTHSPCITCASLIHGAKISMVYYKNDFRSSDGLEHLRQCGIEVIKYNGGENESIS
jgi:dCMP deaminase